MDIREHINSNPVLSRISTILLYGLANGKGIGVQKVISEPERGKLEYVVTISFSDGEALSEKQTIDNPYAHDPHASTKHKSEQWRVIYPELLEKIALQLVGLVPKKLPKEFADPAIEVTVADTGINLLDEPPKKNNKMQKKIA